MIRVHSLGVHRRLPGSLLFLGMSLAVLLMVACASSSTTPAPAAPTPTAAPAPKPTPAATPSSTAPTAAATRKNGDPQIPGGPPSYGDEVAKYPGSQVLQRWGYERLSLWTKAVYGGDAVLPSYSSVTTWFRVLDVNSSRFDHMGMLLYYDWGRCSMVGREDFSVCKGERSNPSNFVVVPGIFQRWEQPDPTTYVFKVRQGVLWPATPPMARTNREVTAEDIVFYMDVIRKESVSRDTYASVKTIEALDRYTVKLTMVSPSADFLRILANPSNSGGIFPRECYEQKSCLQADNKSISPGPFLVKEHAVRQKLVLEKNPEFFLKGLPYLDRSTRLNITDPATLKAGFMTGKFDTGISGPTVAETELALKQNPDIQVQALCGIGTVSGPGIHPKYAGPLADARVRRAMTMTMDFPSMTAAASNSFSMPPTLIGRDYFGPDFYPTYEQLGENYQFNPEKAKQLMADAGYPNGFQTTITTSAANGRAYDYPLYLQVQWKKLLNIDVKIVVGDTSTTTNLWYERKWDGLLFLSSHSSGTTGGFASADEVVGMYVTGNAFNNKQVSDPKIDELYRQQHAEMDPAKRVKLLWEFDQYERSQVYFLHTGCFCTLVLAQPWEMNAQVPGITSFGGASGTWLSMFDPAKAPKSR